MSDTIRVLHVDDDPSYGELVADYLEREDERFVVETADGAAEGLERIERGRPDCVVSDYEMPGTDGIEFLSSVRESYPDLPFVLFTGKGSEEVASEAISAGATDYLQKQPGSDRYELLANRLLNAVEQHRSRRELERERSRMQFALEATDAAVWTLDPESWEMEIQPSVCPLFDVEIDAFETFLDHVHRQDRSRVRETVDAAGRSGESYSVQFRYPADGELRWGQMIGRTIEPDDDDPFQTGITRDITTRKQRERRFETLTDNLPGMVYRCRNEPGWPMEDVRGDVAAFTGHTAAELETGEVEWGNDVVHPDDREWVWTEVQSSLAPGESFELTYRTVTDDGETRWVWERGRGVYGPENELDAIEGFVTDVTDRKRRERELRETSRRFQSVLDTVEAAIFIKDTEGRYQLMNPACREFLGVDADTDVTGLTDHDLLPADTAERLREHDRRVLERGESIETEEPMPTPDGDRIWLTVESPMYGGDGEPVGVSGVSTDITERRAREDELSAIRDRMEFALDRTDSVIWEWTPETGRMTSYPDPCPVLGQSFGTGEEFYTMVHEDDRTALEAAYRAALETDEHQTLEFRTAPGPDTEWVECQIHPLTEEGSLSRMIAVARDVTDRKRRERRLERQNERFDRLGSVVSHDLRSPISAVRGRLQLARETGEFEHLADALSAVERLEALRTDLVGMIRGGAIVGETEPVDVSAAATTAWDGVKSPEGATLDTVEAPTVEGDPDAIRRLLQNLLSNAVEHADGPTTVRLGPCDGGFYVEDAGPGIDPENREAVFDPGYTTKSGGTGMGMASVEQIVQEHGWTIDVVDPEQLDGVRFEITP